MIDQTNVQIPTLMMIDDDEIDQMMYKRIVAKSGVVTTLVQFCDAREALKYLYNQTQPRPDLIALDINMPVMSGFEFLDALSERDLEAQSPVIVMLTTSLSPVDMDQAREYEMVKKYSTKPLTKDVLTEFAELLHA